MLADYPADHATFTGGVQTATAGLLEGLRHYQDEFDFHLVTTSTAIDADRREQRDGFYFHFLSIPRRWVRPRLLIRTIRAGREVKRIRPQLVHSQANAAGSIAVTPRGRTTHVHTVHGILRDEVRLRTGWEFWAACSMLPLEQLLFHQCDAFICISDYAARVVGSNRATYSIPNAVGSSFLQTARQEPPEALRLVFTGVLAPIKRPLDLIRAHARLRATFPTLHTSFCGSVQDERYMRELEATISANQVEGVDFLGTVPRERLAHLLSDATALVLPSAQENTPMVIAEAMAVGVPVVATDVGAVGEMINHGQTGFLYAPGDVDALTRCLQLLLVDRALQKRLGHRAQLWARQKYAPATVAQATVGVYRELLGLRPRQRMLDYAGR